jgi:hypothetical protein
MLLLSLVVLQNFDQTRIPKQVDGRIFVLQCYYHQGKKMLVLLLGCWSTQVFFGFNTMPIKQTI